MRTHLPSALVSTLALGALAAAAIPTATAQSPADPASGPDVRTGGDAADVRDVLDRAQQLQEALPRLGDDVRGVARANGLSVAELRAEASDEALWLDTDGRLFFRDPIPRKRDDSRAEPAAFAYSETFALHSRPGSPRTVYLDFDGHVLQGTAWQKGRKAVTINPYDTDGDPTTFSTAEQDVVQSVWARVAEDYAAVDVDVTTEEPPQDRITRDGATDQVYGTRLLVSPDDFYYSSCGCGGVAYVGVFDLTSRHDYYQPAWVFTRGVGTGPKNIAEAASHEVGHNLGLSHDGTSTVGYYRGHGAWAPIMGVGYYEPISQWSRGEYADANNGEDDFTVMAANGGLPVADDHGDTSATASPLGSSATGVIGSAADRDVFAVDHPGGTLRVTVDPAAVSANLDARLELLDATGAVVASADPASAQVDGDTAGGLGATVSLDLPAGRYLVRVDGVGAGDPLTTGYSDYGSVGAFTVTRG